MKNRIFAFLLVVVLFASCFMLFPSAEGTDGIAVQYATTLLSGSHADSEGNIVDIPKSVFSLTQPSDVLWYRHDFTYETAIETSRAASGVSTYGWNILNLRVTLKTDLSAVDLSKYDLKIDWSVNNFLTVTDQLIQENEYSSFDGTCGLSSANSGMFCPRFKSTQTYNSPISHDMNTMSQSYVITDNSTITDMMSTSTSWLVFLPFYNCTEWETSVAIDLRFTLVEKTTYPAGDMNLGIPDSYTFNIPMNYGFTAPKMISCGISDVYLHNGAYNFRDYSDYYKFMCAFSPWSDYSALFTLTPKKVSDIGDTNAWKNSALDVISFDVPYTVTLPENFDLNAQKVEYLFRFRIAGAENQLIWYDLENLVGGLYNQFYDFQPYAIKVGGLTIGWKYFEARYIDSLHTLEVSLRLSSEDETQRAFLRALLENSSFRLTFSVDDDMHGAGIGICTSGFFLGDAPIVPDSTNNNFSQADLDAAFNRGYSSGLSDGSDKNYVFGFVNGTWSAFNDFYKTVTNGISIGGVTLSAVITSVCIIVVLVFVLKKVL